MPLDSLSIPQRRTEPLPAPEAARSLLLHTETEPTQECTDEHKFSGPSEITLSLECLTMVIQREPKKKEKRLQLILSRHYSKNIRASLFSLF